MGECILRMTISRCEGPVGIYSLPLGCCLDLHGDSCMPCIGAFKSRVKDDRASSGFSFDSTFCVNQSRLVANDLSYAAISRSSAVQTSKACTPIVVTESTLVDPAGLRFMEVTYPITFTQQPMSVWLGLRVSRRSLTSTAAFTEVPLGKPCSIVRVAEAVEYETTLLSC